ncbi:glandular kallikrein-3, submandibular-like isoform X3 [Bacillus rossius redtenbacheri]|uniref:glandular kallikrein-3, submandibular-like isoform X3 n=1 Tax=Bacillus rossius redtenbacheri TaxID=93214 RepID=UPI002FDEE546
MKSLPTVVVEASSNRNKHESGFWLRRSSSDVSLPTRNGQWCRCSDATAHFAVEYSIRQRTKNSWRTTSSPRTVPVSGVAEAKWLPRVWRCHHQQHDGAHSCSLRCRLSVPLSLGRNHVDRVQLAIREMPAGTSCTVSGWGATEESNTWLPDILNYVNVPTISLTDCARFFAMNSALICAGDVEVGGIDACQGDSGGPMVCSGLLIGVVSYGRGCGKPRSPGVYSSVPYYSSWINAVLSSSNTLLVTPLLPFLPLAMNVISAAFP